MKTSIDLIFNHFSRRFLRLYTSLCLQRMVRLHERHAVSRHILSKLFLRKLAVFF